MEEYNQKDIYIENSKPKKDCKYCIIRNFQDASDQYAECNNQKKCKGLWRITITKNPSFGMWGTSCKNCKEYANRQELELF